MWFTSLAVGLAWKASYVARVAPDGSVREYLLPIDTDGLGLIAAGPGGTLWYTEKLSDTIGRITPFGTTDE